MINAFPMIFGFSGRAKMPAIRGQHLPSRARLSVNITRYLALLLHKDKPRRDDSDPPGTRALGAISGLT